MTGENGTVTKVEPAGALVGHIAVPGDKSISHRALLIGALAEGETRVRGFGRSADTESTLNAVRVLGVDVEEAADDEFVVHGVGLRGLRPPEAPIDAGNAGTLMRLLTGVLSGQEGRFELTGDESLKMRPMDRVAEPLTRMGARIATTNGLAPVVIEGTDALRAIDYALPVASAQVKSAILLAGLNAKGRTTVSEPVPTRDHTELMLDAAGARVRRRPNSVSLDAPPRLLLAEVTVPGDFSAAAPFIVAATLLAGSELTIHDLGLNPRRTGLLDVLERMGARISVFNRRKSGGELIGDLEVRSSELTATDVGPEEVPQLVDELPLFALAAAVARGDSHLTGAGELRLKESDRIETVTTGLRTLGVHIRPRDDGFDVRGVPARPTGGRMPSNGDHRIAVLAAVAGLVSREGVEVGGADAVAISFPGFFDLLDSVSKR
ncbi:MAG: 3-phosphoshikimate 1-carboxyvinyltransferase [Actinobacteria bacterium]|nr:MAG: 3-phosphoshikimate 1-carboxyvinyltransferase [Actinomycetota bacterium]